MTLLEVIAGLALLGSVLVAMLLARAGYQRQAAHANRRLEAVAAADALLSAWHTEPARLRPESSGVVAGDAQLAWRTHIVPSAEAEALGARVVRLEVLDERAAVGPPAVLTAVEFLAEPENHQPLAPPTTLPAAGGSGNSQQGKHKGVTRTHATGIHTPCLLAATALSALLMVAVLHVMGTIGRDRRAMAARPGPQVWRADLLDTLRRDLAGSNGILYGNNTMVLIGEAALDRRTLATRDEPVTVTYSLTLLHGRTWLTRRQAARNASGGESSWIELLCPDVVAFSVQAGESELGAGTPSALPGDAQTPRSVPATVVLHIEMLGQAPIEETLVVR